MPHTATYRRVAIKHLADGVRSISLTPSMKGARVRVAQNGVAADWKNVGKDLRSAMKKFELERAR